MVTLEVASAVLCAQVLLFSFIVWLTDRRGNLIFILLLPLAMTPVLSAIILHCMCA